MSKNTNDGFFDEFCLYDIRAYVRRTHTHTSFISHILSNAHDDYCSKQRLANRYIFYFCNVLFVTCVRRLLKS